MKKSKDKKSPRKNAVKTKKVEDKDEFRKLNTREEKGHLQYVCGRVGNEYESVGVTHGKRTKGVNNIPLKKNPNPERNTL